MNPDESWMHAGLCRTEQPDLFFPVHTNQYAATLAVQVCKNCPVLAECLAFSLGADVDGVWGGTTARERDRLRRKLGLPRRPGVKGDKFKRERGAA